MMVFHEYIVIDHKKCIFAIENDIFDCQMHFCVFFKNLESGSPGPSVESVQYVLKRVSFGSKDCTKELKLECAYFLGQTS